MHDFKDGRADFADSVGFDPYWERLYAEHYSQQNVWLTDAPHLYIPGRVAVSQEATADDRLINTEFYSDYLRPQGYFHAFGVTIGSDRSVRSYLTALRPLTGGAFQEQETALLRLLMPHLDCALRVHSRISGLQERMNASASALDHFPCGLVLMNALGRPVLVNRSARRIFDQHDGFTLAKDGLSAATHATTQSLRKLVHAAIEGDIKAGTPPCGAGISVVRPSQRRPYEVLVLSLPGGERLREAPAAAAAVFISDPEDEVLTDLDALRALYGFTVAEARMAAALVRGRSVEAAAEEFGVSVHTARTQVKSILSKTQTNRQTDLLRLLLKSPARFGHLAKLFARTGV